MSAQSSTPSSCDWQISRSLVKERGQYLFETGLWSDCQFVVGTEPNQQVLDGHKLFLAMSSPVFGAMFFGGMPEKGPIAILDVQPDAFKALLEYIYTDKINFTSFDQACELCYGAKKYMLPHLVEECTKYLWSDLYPKNACRAYEFAKLFEERTLMDKCLHIICNQTQDVLYDSSFDDIQFSTLLTILDQENLSITCELELFNAVSRYASKHNQHSGVKVSELDGIDSSSNETTNSNQPTIRDAIKKIRFLTMTPQQFAEVSANCNLLTESEKYAILMNICSPSAGVSIPEGFSTLKVSRQKYPHFSGIFWNSEGTGTGPEFPKKFYCTRTPNYVTDYMNRSILDCSVTFTCDRNICVYGIQIPAQIPSGHTRNESSYFELLFAHLLDADGSRLTYTHFTGKVSYNSLIEIAFNRPVYIQRNKTYKIGVSLNHVGMYQLGTYPRTANSNGVIFTFYPTIGENPTIDGLVNSIIFSIPPAHGMHNTF